ncbi:hypothetical protein AB0N17_13630 [Streptomyces sp. NPDC051133]|uniref:hypothetical protein n=1 Tax=Streptomyces sp. NPDC051133 TaxID=3155521 RepID=UPI00342CF781
MTTDAVQQLVDDARDSTRRAPAGAIALAFAPPRKPGQDADAHARSVVQLWDDEQLQARLLRDVAREPFIDQERLIRYLQRANLATKPAVLWEAFTSNRLAPGTLTPIIGGAWCYSLPGSLPFDQWRQLFAEAGYTDDGHAVPRPRKPVELWRGAPTATRAGHYWTSHRAYAERYVTARTGQLWRTLAPPTALMCRATAWSTDGFDEYAVDTRGLTITPAT